MNPFLYTGTAAHRRTLRQTKRSAAGTAFAATTAFVKTPAFDTAIAAVAPVLLAPNGTAFAATTAFVRIMACDTAIAAVAPVLAFTSHKMSRVAGVR